MRCCLLSLSLLLALPTSVAWAQQAHPQFDYQRQAIWPAVLDHAQSPVNIVTASARQADSKESAALVISAGQALSKVEDNGHSVQVNSEHVEAIIRGRHFVLSQFHFHTGSEHTINGKAYPVEAHFVFKAQDGRLAVVGVMYQDGAANPAFDAVLQQLRDAEHAPAQVNVSELLPRDLSYYHYLGSLTTPPLTENVEWYVLEHPMTLSHAEVQALAAIHPHNNRKQQPMYERPLIHYGE